MFDRGGFSIEMQRFLPKGSIQTSVFLYPVTALNQWLELNHESPKNRAMVDRQIFEHQQRQPQNQPPSCTF